MSACVRVSASERTRERASEKHTFSVALIGALGEQRASMEGERVEALELQEQRLHAEYEGELRALHALIDDLRVSAQSVAVARGAQRAVPKLSRYGKFKTVAMVPVATGKVSSSSSSVCPPTSMAGRAAIDGSPLVRYDRDSESSATRLE